MNPRLGSWDPLKKSRISVLQQHRYGLNPRSTGIWDPSRQGMNPRLGSWDPRESGIPRAGMNPRLGSERMNPRRESGMETATKTGIEKVEDLPFKKFGIKTNRRLDFW